MTDERCYSMIFKKMQNLLKGPLYQYDHKTKSKLFLEAVRQVSEYHYENCIPYQKLCKKREVNLSKIDTIEDFPYLPTSIFKETLLLSISKEDVFREIRSSATTSGLPSRIGLNKENNRRWSFSMQRMLLDRIGNKRYRTMVLDNESALGRSDTVSARSSMTRALLFSASEVSTCLVTEGELLRLDQEKLVNFLNNAGDGSDIIVFGFTFILYSHVLLPLIKTGKCFNLPGLKIIHAGGWKKLESQKVTSQKLIEDCCMCFGTKPENIVDLYGFSEQGGLLYPTCEYGLRHTPAWSEVVCRDPLTLKALPVGKEGMMQFVTPIQTSYPGHSILTEDVGKIVGYDNCLCGRKGTTFKVTGRSLSATEERGCGDIMADLFA